MSKSPPISRPRVWKDKYSLAIHPTVAETPEDRLLIDQLVSDWTAKIQAGHDPHELIRETIKVNAEGEIGDGRHRQLAALRVPQIQWLECEQLDAADFESLVVEMLLQRRHYSKSARAYSLRHMAARAVNAGREARKANLVGPREAGGVYRKPIQSAFGKNGEQRTANSELICTLESLAAKSGFRSTDLLQQAVKLERDYMTRADALIADWLALNSEDGYAADWQRWSDSHPTAEMPWTCWRSQKLAHHGLPDDAKSVNIIPKHWREIEEDKIFNGIHEADGEDDDRRSYSLGSALKAMGSYFATAGQVRSDVNKDNPALYITLKNKLLSFGKTMWSQWSEVDPAGRMEVIKELATNVTTWPDDVRRAVAVALTKGL